MKTLLEAIQQYPDQFISTLEARANTTPNPTNRSVHLTLADCIDLRMWNEVEDIIQLVKYRKPFEGVIYCLDSYSEIDNTVWHEVVDLFEQERFV